MFFASNFIQFGGLWGNDRPATICRRENEIETEEKELNTEVYGLRDFIIYIVIIKMIGYKSSNRRYGVHPMWFDSILQSVKELTMKWIVCCLGFDSECYIYIITYN